MGQKLCVEIKFVDDVPVSSKIVEERDPYDGMTENEHIAFQNGKKESARQLMELIVHEGGDLESAIGMVADAILSQTPGHPQATWVKNKLTFYDTKKNTHSSCLR